MGFERSPFDSFMFTAIPTLVMFGFIAVFVIILISIVRGIGKWSYNNAQPVLTVAARVVTKRTSVSSSMHHDSDNFHHHHSSSTTYFTTFEVESGSRMEFHVSAQEYGMLVEGDFGKLTFQGSRYFGFERQLTNDN